MKRFIITALAATLVLGTTMAADAVRQHRLAEDAMAIEQAWSAWLLGGSSNALLAEDFCGEVVDGKFFLTVTMPQGRANWTARSRAGCRPSRRRSGLSRGHRPTGRPGRSCSKDVGLPERCRAQSREGRCRRVDPTEGPMLCSQPFDISLEPGNSLQQLDPKVKGDSTKVVTCGWFYLVGPLSPGSHTIDMAGKVKGSDGFSLRYNVTVT